MADRDTHHPRAELARRAWWPALLLSALVLIMLGGLPGAAGAVEPSAASDAVALDELDAVGGGASAGGALLIVAALAAMIVLGSPLFLILGVLAALSFLTFGEGYADNIDLFQVFPAKMGSLATKPVLLAIPFFVISGAIMSAGDIANRLVGVARAMFSGLPGGLAIATVSGCVFFAAISGSSPVTVIAIGTVMYPALVKASYSERFSLGLVSSAGSLGILIPPSIPMLVYAIAAGGSRSLDVGELFMAGILPGLLIAGLLAAYSVVVAVRTGTDGSLDKARLVRAGSVLVALVVLPVIGETTGILSATTFLLLVGFAALGLVILWFRDAFWAVMLPVVILGGIYSGLFTATEAAAVSVIYALVVELFIHRKIKFADLAGILAEAAILMGTLLIIMALAFGLNDFLVEEKVPDRAVAWILGMNLTPVQFLLIMNILLLVVGALMDAISAILILAPMLAPIAYEMGVDPIHLGVIFIVNLEIGYLTPPIGINLFVASSVFNKPIGEVIKAVVPYIVIMVGGLMLVTYVPTIALGPVNLFLRDKPFYEPLRLGVREAAGDGTEEAAPGAALSDDQLADIAKSMAEGETEGGDGKEFAGGKVLSLDELSALAEMIETEGAEHDDDDDEEDETVKPKIGPPAGAPGMLPLVPSDGDDDDDDE